MASQRGPTETGEALKLPATVNLLSRRRAVFLPASIFIIDSTESSQTTSGYPQKLGYYYQIVLPPRRCLFSLFSRLQLFFTLISQLKPNIC
jgi:hypothetical protein